MRKTILLFFICLSFLMNAQKLFKGVGVFGALTVSKHEYNNLDTDKKPGNDSILKYFNPESHVSKEFLNWGAGVFLELSGRDDIRWQTELEYANKGAKEMALVNPITGDRSGSYSANKLTYIQWNNYVKFYNPIFYDKHWYFMAGVRLEYLFKKSASVYPEVVNTFPKFWFSGDLALGYEFPIAKKISAFVETHWNPDILTHKYNGNTNVRARTFEARVGLVMRPRKKRIDDCNAPVYRGPAY